MAIESLEICTLDVSAAESLRVSLEADRAQAWEIAHYEREHEGKLTSQIRFGLTAANAASMVTVLNVGQALHTSSATTAQAAAFFLLGTVLAGVSLLAQQNSQIRKAGNARARAITLDRAVSLARPHAIRSRGNELAEAMNEAAEAGNETFKVSYTSIAMQNLGMAAWLGGALVVAWPTFAPLAHYFGV